MATRYWLGAAVPVREVWAISVSGTWTEGDTAWVEISGKQLILTVGEDEAIDDVGAALEAMINGDDVIGTESRSALGSGVGEFALLTASYNATENKLFITGPTDGRPCGTVSVGQGVVDSGELTVVGGVVSVAGTGPNYFSDAENWSGGAVPVDNDDIVFDHQAAASCLYGLDQSSTTPTSVVVTSGFRYAIGLPQVNRDSPSLPYNEHRLTYLALDGGGTVVIDGSGGQLIKLDTGSKSTSVTVNATGAVQEANVPSVLLRANHAASVVAVTGGRVGLNYEPKVSGEVATVFVGGAGNPQVEIGNSTTVATIRMTNGGVVNRSAATTVNINGGSYSHYGGAITTLSVDGGAVSLYSTATITTVNVSAAMIDATRDSRARTFTTTNVYPRASIQDPSGTITFTNGLNLYCKPTEITLDLPPRKKYTIGSI